MNCPYCRQALTETSPECPKCQLNLDRASGQLGPVPRVEPGVSDSTRALTSRERRDLFRRIKRLERRFPQIQIQVVCHSFPDDHPLPLYVFWLFNLGGFANSVQKAGDNHTVLLVLDPVIGKSSLMVGYGLEPFLGELALDHLLEMAEPAWNDRAWAEGIQRIIEGLEPLLESAIRETGSTFDLPVSPASRKAGEF